MLYRSKQNLSRQQSMLVAGSVVRCRTHDDVDVESRIVAIIHRHHCSGVLLTMYVLEQINASNVILAALSPLKCNGRGLVAMLIMPYQIINRERRTIYRGDGIFLGTKNHAVQMLLNHLEEYCNDTEFKELHRPSCYEGPQLSLLQ